MTSARTDDGIAVEWTSTSLGAEALDAALNRGVYEIIEADLQKKPSKRRRSRSMWV